MAKKKDEIAIRSSTTEYLTYVASVGDHRDSIRMRRDDENIYDLRRKRWSHCTMCMFVS